MVDISYEFFIELTEDQKADLKSIMEIAKKDNGNVILFLSGEELKGYIVPKYKIDLLNNILDQKNKSKKPKIRVPKFNGIMSREKLIEEN